MLGLQAMQEEPWVKAQLIKSKSRIEAIAIVHEMLYKQENFEEIVFNDYVEKLNQLIISMFSIDKKVIVDIKENDNLTLSLDTMIQLGLIVNEMLTNTFKYVKNVENIQINISLRKDGEEFILTYSDNGQDYVDVESLKDSKGLGMKLINLSTKQLLGDLSIKYSEGLNYEMRFKNA